MILDPLRLLDTHNESGLGFRFDEKSTTKNTYSVPSTDNTWSDATIEFDYTLTCAGEEKSDGEPLQKAVDDLRSKFGRPFAASHYGNLEYILAHAAAGKEVQFWSIATATGQVSRAYYESSSGLVTRVRSGRLVVWQCCIERGRS
jgi:hypothetical protein